MTSETRTESGKPIKLTYVFDQMDQIAGFTKSDGYAKSYAYDAANELKTMMVAAASRRN